MKDGDVLAVASKVVSTCESRIVRLDGIPVSQRAKQTAKKWSMDERLAALVLKEADKIFGGVRGFLLTLKNGILTANAGVDLKNSPPGTCTLWPKNPDSSAGYLRKFLAREYKVRMGVEIVDSRVTPLRLGTTGLAIGISGFLPVVDERGKPDLYGRKLRATQTNIADDLAAAAHLLMGESNEQTGAVLIRKAPIQLSDVSSSRKAELTITRCLILSGLRRHSR